MLSHAAMNLNSSATPLPRPLSRSLTPGPSPQESPSPQGPLLSSRPLSSSPPSPFPLPAPQGHPYAPATHWHTGSCGSTPLPRPLSQDPLPTPQPPGPLTGEQVHVAHRDAQLACGQRQRVLQGGAAGKELSVFIFWGGGGGVGRPGGLVIRGHRLVPGPTTPVDTAKRSPLSCLHTFLLHTHLHSR